MSSWNMSDANRRTVAEVSRLANGRRDIPRTAGAAEVNKRGISGCASSRFRAIARHRRSTASLFIQYSAWDGTIVISRSPRTAELSGKSNNSKTSGRTLRGTGR